MPINYKLYPHNWKTVIVPQVRARSGDKCETCGLHNGEAVISVQVKKWNGKKWVYRRVWTTLPAFLGKKNTKVVKVVLTVAHKNHDPLNASVLLEDLIHECQRCHLKRDAYPKARRRACGKWCSYPHCGKHTCQQFWPPVHAQAIGLSIVSLLTGFYGL